MKKIMLAVAAVGVFSSSAFAGWYTGTVKEVRQYPNNQITIIIDRDDSTTDIPGDLKSSMPTDERKSFLAILLTAKAQSATVQIHLSTDGWDAIRY